MTIQEKARPVEAPRPSRYQHVLDAHDWDKEAYIYLTELAAMSASVRVRFLLWKPSPGRLLNPRFYPHD